MHPVILQPVPGARWRCARSEGVWPRRQDGAGPQRRRRRFLRQYVHGGDGPSGSGTSTLLHSAAALDRPSPGMAWLAGTDLAGLAETALTKLGRTRIGFVFQAFNLVPALSVQENIQRPLSLGWLPVAVERDRPPPAGAVTSPTAMCALDACRSREGNCA